MVPLILVPVVVVLGALLNVLAGPLANYVNLQKKPLFIVTAVVVCILCAASGVMYWIQEHQPQPSTPHGMFVYPREGSIDVPRDSILARGTVSGIEEGHSLWLFLYVPDVKCFYAGDLDISPKGGSWAGENVEWSGHIFIGGSQRKGERLQLVLASLDPVALDILRREEDNTGKVNCRRSLGITDKVKILHQIVIYGA